jgi:hypothetical protein
MIREVVQNGIYELSDNYGVYYFNNIRDLVELDNNLWLYTSDNISYRIIRPAIIISDC